MPMRFRALCCDYDGTLAHHGVMAPATIAALERVAASGRCNVLVTGRHLDDLQRILPRLDLFACVVAENGALLYTPAAREERLLTVPPAADLVELLVQRGVSPLSVGRAIIATREPHETTVIEAVSELRLALQVIFNKGAVMVLPNGVDKASGLRAALQALAIAPVHAIGVGDAENDQSFLALCGCAVAVANALPGLKRVADLVTASAQGVGVVELIEALLEDDLARALAAARVFSRGNRRRVAGLLGQPRPRSASG